MQQAILQPVLAMVVLSFVVWVALFVTRFRVIGQLKIDPEQMDTPDKVAALMPPVAANPAYNFRNLSEVPVLFYVMCFYLYLTGQADNLAVNLAWAFVMLRAVHSLIQCTYNKVMHRFLVYLLSSIAVWVMMFRAVATAL
jgi:hypothetical protein